MDDSPQNDKTLSDFCAVTGARPEIAASYLTVYSLSLVPQYLLRIFPAQARSFYSESFFIQTTKKQVSDNNLQQAVSLYLESGGVDLTQALQDSKSSQQPTPSASSTSDGTRTDNSTLESDAALAARLAAEEVRAPIPPRQEILLRDDDDELYPQTRRSTTTRNSRPVVREVTDGLRDSRLDSAYISGQHDPKLSPRLADLFRPPFDLITPGGFEQVRQDAKEKNKWLMVTIHDYTEFACQVLNRDLWSEQTVKAVVKADFLFMQLPANSSEGRRYKTFYPFDDYPHIAIIDPRTGERLKTFNYSLTPNDFIIAVTDFLERYSLKEAASSKSPAVAQSTSQRIYDVSDEDEAADSRLPADAIDFMEIEDQSDDESQGVSAFDMIHPTERAEPAEGPSVTRIQFRLADGSRIIRRFAKSDPVRYLFEYIKATVPAAAENQFELVFNRQQLIEYIDQTIAEAGLENSAVTVGIVS
ncbi:8106_t:CDS:10 [Paraglomus occultum]|uniref:8106_t:CDS:1 n=1 Tax=Paraglomus occultum TaxID=144539 RepID=A0A9N8W1H6_9GLOM|nr:8106_t:CDS:10 [Paraglomus occultum]